MVIPDACILCLHHVSLITQLFYNIMQIFSFALSLYALCYCAFCFANKSVGAIIRARIKTIRASEEREERGHQDAITADQETAPGGQGDTGRHQPIRGQYPGHVTSPSQSEASAGDPQEVKCPATCSIRRVSQSHRHHRFIKNKLWD